MGNPHLTCFVLSRSSANTSHDRNQEREDARLTTQSDKTRYSASNRDSNKNTEKTDHTGRHEGGTAGNDMTASEGETHDPTSGDDYSSTASETPSARSWLNPPRVTEPLALWLRNEDDKQHASLNRLTSDGACQTPQNCGNTYEGQAEEWDAHGKRS